VSLVIALIIIIAVQSSLVEIKSMTFFKIILALLLTETN